MAIVRKKGVADVTKRGVADVTKKGVANVRMAYVPTPITLHCTAINQSINEYLFQQPKLIFQGIKALK